MAADRRALVGVAYDRRALAVETVTDARHAALERLIDHAALFPPASMPVEAALDEDARVRAAETGWLVGRFVVRASQLPEVVDPSLRLSVVADSAVPVDDPRVEAVEIPVSNSLLQSPPAAEVFVELPVDDLGRLEELDGARAKVRCGGEAIPSVSELAAFIRRCRDLGVAFKATAGLHHAVRTDGEHGFLNLLAACCLGFEEAVLADEDPAAFQLTPDRLSWRGRRCDAAKVGRVRRDLFTSFGSCSVQEPLDDLKSMGIL